MPASSKTSQQILDIVALLTAAFALHAAFGFNSPTLGLGGLLDTDAYMRLIRVEALWNNGEWYQTVTQTLGAPDGLSLHWTRPLDILILLPALLLTLFGIEIHTAIYWSGVVIAPVLHTAACFAAAWAAKPLLPQHGAWRLAALMLLLNGSALSYSLAGRPDHHPLTLLVAVMGAGYMIRAFLTPSLPRPAFLAGIWGGIGIWIAPEAMLTIAPALATIGLLWLCRRSDENWAALGFRYGVGMTLVILMAVIVEQPPSNWWNAEYDKVSILYLAIAIAIAVDFRLAGLVSSQGWRRLAWALPIVVGTFFILALIFPRFYLGPLGGINDAAAQVFMNEVSEMQPLWPVDYETTMQLFRTTGNALAAIPVGAYFLWVTRHRPDFSAFLYLSIAFSIALVAAMFRLRLTLPVGAFGAILGCGLFAIICQFAVGRGNLIMLCTRLAAYFLVVIGLQLIGMVHLVADDTADNRECNPIPVARWLGDHHLESAGFQAPPIILTDGINAPPAIAYLTDYRLVGGPYHRGNDDVADMIATMASSDANESLAIVKRRKVDLILICTDKTLRAIRESGENSLYHRLSRGDTPEWLAPIPMPGEDKQSFRLFSVQH